jgi:hypothetical protein
MMFGNQHHRTSLFCYYGQYQRTGESCVANASYNISQQYINDEQSQKSLKTKMKLKAWQVHQGSNKCYDPLCQKLGFELSQKLYKAYLELHKPPQVVANMDTQEKPELLSEAKASSNSSATILLFF